MMSSIQRCDLPPGALLGKYLQGESYVDCYVTEVTKQVSHAEYVEAFYTTAVFKIERLLLAWFVSRPSTDEQARQLATGMLGAFAAWSVEGRSADQLLLSDIGGRTRSWLMVAVTGTIDSPCTRLYFGSAVVPVVNARYGQASLGLAFRVLLGFHMLYSRVLLRAASSRLGRLR